MIIHVTQEDIAHGIAMSKMFCPIARAVNRAMKEGGNKVQVKVVHDIIAVEIDNKGTVGVVDCPMNSDVVEWMDNYDAGQDVAPMDFDLFQFVRIV